MNTKIIVGVVGAVVIAGVAFYGGIVYGKSSAPVRGQFANGQFIGGPKGAGGGTGMRGGANGGGLTAGEIISKDATSITIKMQDGSTKIVLVSDSTQIMKTSAGSSGDLSVGTTVAVTGTANSDGSITGQSVQIRPAGSVPLGGTPPVNQGR